MTIDNNFSVSVDGLRAFARIPDNARSLLNGDVIIHDTKTHIHTQTHQDIHIIIENRNKTTINDNPGETTTREKSCFWDSHKTNRTSVLL